MRSIYDLIVEIDNCPIEGIFFDKIEGYSCVGDVRSNAYEHPIQYVALSTSFPGMDAPFQGIGWTPAEALRNLLGDINKK